MQVLGATHENPAERVTIRTQTAARRFGVERFQATLRGIVAETVRAERSPRQEDRRPAASGLLRPFMSDA